jgi:cell volume regulation protein A
MGAEVAFTLVILAALFVLGALGEILFVRTRIPDVLWLICTGVLLRVTGLVDPMDFAGAMPVFGAITLVVVLFEGGTRLVFEELVSAAPRAAWLATVGFVASMLGIAVASTAASAIGLALGAEWSLAHGLMLGAILGGSSSIIVMPSMALARVDGKVANVVGVESALTDALCVVTALTMIQVVIGEQTGLVTSLGTLASSFGIALLFGFAGGLVWFPVLRMIRGNPHAYPLTLAAILLLFVLVDRAGGSAALAILAFAILVGNADAIMKAAGFSAGPAPLELDEQVRTVHTQLSFFIKSFFFTYIGTMIPLAVAPLLLGVLLAFVLLGMRVLSTRLTLPSGEYDDRDRGLVEAALPRGMAAGVLAAIPATLGVQGVEGLPSLVFATVIATIVIFAVLFRRVSARPLHGPLAVPKRSPASDDSGVLPTARAAAVTSQLWLPSMISDWGREQLGRGLAPIAAPPQPAAPGPPATPASPTPPPGHASVPPASAAVPSPAAQAIYAPASALLQPPFAPLVEPSVEPSVGPSGGPSVGPAQSSADSRD